MSFVGCFIAFTIYCWLFDIAHSGRIEVRNVWTCMTIWGVSLICSLALWRSHRWFTAFGLVACVLWMVWALWPRLSL